MFSISFGEYEAHFHDGTLPPTGDSYLENAELAEQYDLDSREGQLCFFAVGRPSAHWPSLVVAQRYHPSSENGFWPGALIVPETSLVFLGAGERLLCYSLLKPTRVWEDVTFPGFWSWSRHADIVLMAAEME